MRSGVWNQAMNLTSDGSTRLDISHATFDYQAARAIPVLRDGCAVFNLNGALCPLRFDLSTKTRGCLPCERAGRIATAWTGSIGGPRWATNDENDKPHTGRYAAGARTTLRSLIPRQEGAERGRLEA